jgi:tetratricopeptide (TPR) repeat protein
MTTLERLEALEFQILDPGARFSATETLRELLVIHEELHLSAAAAREQQRALHLIHLVNFKIEKFAEAFEYGVRAMKMDPEIAHLSANAAMMFPYRMGECSMKLTRFSEAIAYYRQVLTVLDQQGFEDTDAKLGTLEKIGFCLHEAGSFAEAYNLNLLLLERAERFFGPADPTLSSVLTNLANNLYEVGEFAEAQSYLARGYGICAEIPEKAYEFLFQLGVIAAESGDIEMAEEWFQRQLAIAELLAHDDFIDEALSNLAMIRTAAA